MTQFLSEGNDNPLSEQYRVAAEEWVEADEAASLLEETKSAYLAEMINTVIGYNLKMPYNKAELAAKGSKDYKDFVINMVHLRSKANLLKVQVEYLKMKFSEQQSSEATARAERRM